MLLRGLTTNRVFVFQYRPPLLSKLAEFAEKQRISGSDEVSPSNAFTSAFKQLEPTRQFRATAKLAGSWSTHDGGSVPTRVGSWPHRKRRQHRRKPGGSPGIFSSGISQATGAR